VVNQRGQTVVEFVVATMLLMVFGILLYYGLLAQPNGAVMKMQDKVSTSIAND
jgi:hypothetical protein